MMVERLQEKVGKLEEAEMSKQRRYGKNNIYFAED